MDQTFINGAFSLIHCIIRSCFVRNLQFVWLKAYNQTCVFIQLNTGLYISEQRMQIMPGRKTTPFLESSQWKKEVVEVFFFSFFWIISTLWNLSILFQQRCLFQCDNVQGDLFLAELPFQAS